MKRICAVLAMLAVGAIGGFLGHASGAQADTAHRRTATSDKTLYATSDGSINRTDPGTDFNATTLLRIHLNVPSAGTAAVEIDTAVYSDFSADSGSSSVLASDALYERCTAVATHAGGGHCQELNDFDFIQPAGATIDSTQPYTQSMVAQFAARATRTIFINVTADNYPAGFKGHLHVQLAFTPAHPIPTSDHASVTTS